jgi:ubiquinone/menaquinone biosynthesis C-methylase UbiE
VKARESGMPDEAYWATFFDADCLIERLFDGADCRGNVVEFGSGYGTFTLPAARAVTGTVFALDIEADLIAHLRRKAAEQGIANIHASVRDFVAAGSGLEPGTQAHAMIYNLLHLEEPMALLAEAYRVLRPGGRLSVIHWRSDIPTPRGPSLDIRPTPAQCKEWIAAAGFVHIRDVDVTECCHFHFGIVAIR